MLRSASIAPISYQSYSLYPQAFMELAANKSVLRRKTFTTFLTIPSLQPGCRYSTSKPTTSDMMDGLLLKFFGLDTATSRSLQGQGKRYADMLLMPTHQTDPLHNPSPKLESAISAILGSLDGYFETAKNKQIDVRFPLEQQSLCDERNHC